jgi:hypothetical protein
MPHNDITVNAKEKLSSCLNTTVEPLVNLSSIITGYIDHGLPMWVLFYYIRK